MTADRFYVIDVETTGLDEKNGSILEIACVVTNVDFEVIAEKSWLIWDDEVNESLLALRRIAADDPEGKTGESFVLNMHQSSGLFDELRDIQESGDTSHSRMIVGVQVFEWLKEQGMEYGYNVRLTIKHNDEVILDEEVALAKSFGFVPLNAKLVFSSETACVMAGRNRGNLTRDYSLGFGPEWTMRVSKI